MINVGIVGGTGYTGAELLRLLAAHSHVQIAVITSRTEAGTKVSNIFPNLRGQVDLPLTPLNSEALAECEVVFFATPHGMACRWLLPYWKRGSGSWIYPRTSGLKTLKSGSSGMGCRMPVQSG